MVYPLAKPTFLQDLDEDYKAPLESLQKNNQLFSFIEPIRLVMQLIH